MFSSTLLVCSVVFGITGVDAFEFSCSRSNTCAETIGTFVGVAIFVAIMIYSLRLCYRRMCGRRSPNTSSLEYDTSLEEDYTTPPPHQAYASPMYNTPQENNTAPMISSAQTTVNINPPIPLPKEEDINKPISDITEAKDTTETKSIVETKDIEEQAQDVDDIKEVIIQVPAITKEESKPEEKPKKEPMKFFSL